MFHWSKESEHHCVQRGVIQLLFCLFFCHLQVHNQASEWWINQQGHQEHAAVGLSCYNCLPHNLLGGDATLLTDVGAQNVFFFFVCVSFLLYFLMKKELLLRPLL